MDGVEEEVAPLEAVGFLVLIRVGVVAPEVRRLMTGWVPGDAVWVLVEADDVDGGGSEAGAGGEVCGVVGVIACAVAGA
ncbi:hypothetical protein ACFQFR_00060 [Streptomyces goshikiensis]